MSNVLIEKNKIDLLANAISAKSGESLTLTLDEMVEAVDGIETGGGGITPTGNIDITQAGVTDVTNYATATVPQGEMSVMANWEYYTENGQRKWRYRGEAVIDTNDGEGTPGFIADGTYVNGSWHPFNAVAKNTTVTPTESSQTIGGFNYMMEGAVTVNAIPSNYVGSGITQRSSSDLTASGATVSVPSGYYASNASKAISNGTAGTPTATKGAVSNHSVSVTPSVTNTTGYITGSTKTGTAVTVSASELVSGSETKTANGTYDVTNLASLVVNVSGGSSKNVQVLQSTSRTNSSSLTKVLGDLTVSKTGTYDIYWSGGRSNTSSSYTWGTRLYVDGSGYGTENTSWSNNCQSNHLSNVSLTANQKLSVYARGRTGSYYTFVPMLVIVES